ncbi:bifunctional serine/threonine-protein kinase/ABC transporter substrate-binding protein [Streptomyces sp. NPDC127039]|uniref:bifunctional serine/threonine-protein kinase/ABC transporter substrate-binding protein n=1 Tax=Streptomyces sp. NPDC127039 TaxID=3347115 RepID=UPI003665F51A
MEALGPSDASRVGGYRLLGRLGAGGMGVVYLGRDASGELAAVKVIQPQYADETDFRARFRREVEAARRVVSPWAVPVLDADTQARAPWLATAFVAGPSLGEALGACGPLPSREVRLLGKVLGRALAAVHEAGLVHRDVKPGNVLLALDGPRLIDFGIARSQSSDETTLTSADVVVGTPGFLSPEQAQARQVSAASDVFSLGCVLAFAASGRMPFGTGEVEAVLYRTVHDEPDLDGVEDDGERAGERAGTGRGPLRDLLKRCLAKDPDDRPSALELDESLIEDTPPATADWLPGPVVRLIADRSAEVLALPGIDDTEIVPDTAAGPGRRRALAWAGGGALLLAGGGAGLWAALRDSPAAAPPRSEKAARQWRIGVQADLTGPGKAAGRAQERGARLAVEQFNADRDKPFTARLEVADDRGEESRAVTVARRFTGDDDMLAVLGPTGDKTALAVLGVYDEASLPLLSVSTALFGQYDRSRAPSHFTAAPSYGLAPAADAALLTSLGIRRVGVLWDRSGSLAGSELGVMAHRMFAGNGLGTYPRVVPRGAKDLVPVVADMADHAIDAFYYTGTPAGGAAVARALATHGFDGPRLIGHPCVGEVFLREAGEAATGWETFAPYIDPSAAPVRDFAAAHRQRYDEEPGHWAVEGFDVVRMVLGRLAESSRRGSRPTRAQLADALGKGTYDGLARTYAFEEDRTLKGGSFFRYRVADGRLRYLGPTPSVA